MNSEIKKRTGKVKWFNVVRGYGFIKPDDGNTDVFVHQNVIKMEGFRSLDENEEVEFECHDTEKGIEATLVTGLGGMNCKGSSYKPSPKRKNWLMKCFSCGRVTDHRAAHCPFNLNEAERHFSEGNTVPSRSNAFQNKLCYQCKSNQHLIKDCPDVKKQGESIQKQKNGHDTDHELLVQGDHLTNLNTEAATNFENTVVYNGKGIEANHPQKNTQNIDKKIETPSDGKIMKNGISYGGDSFTGDANANGIIETGKDLVQGDGQPVQESLLPTTNSETSMMDSLTLNSG